jgi:5-methyltetrahydrofolate--homocysteine methyltransferase
MDQKEVKTMVEFETITETLIQGDEPALIRLVQNALKEGAKPVEILNRGLIEGMNVVGEKMENGDIFIPEVLLSARCMSAAVALLKPLLAADEVSLAGRVVIGTVKGDLHDIGKSLVKLMLESVGFETIDLGVDVAPEKFVQALKEEKANLLAMSALLTTTMPIMKLTIDAMKESGLRDRVKVMVGGAPLTPKFAKDIGADGYAPDAGSATKLAKNLLH